MNVDDIWSSFIKTDNKRQLTIKIQEIKNHNDKIQKKCGSCKLWMTSDCKRESYSKVTCEDTICNDFSMKKWVEEFIKNHNDKIDLLEKELKN